MGQKVGRGKHPASNLSSRELVCRGHWFQQEVLSPTLSVGQKSEALGEFTPESGVGPLRYPTARNKQTSFCSQPGPPPCRIQDVCVSSSLLCLNTVCGMTCEGGQLRRRELGSLGSIPCLPSCFLLTGSPSSSLLPDQSLGLPHPSFSPSPTGGPWCRLFADAPFSDCRPYCPNPSPVVCVMVPGLWLGTLTGFLRPFHSLGDRNFSLLTLGVCRWYAEAGGTNQMSGGNGALGHPGSCSASLSCSTLHSL